MLQSSSLILINFLPGLFLLFFLLSPLLPLSFFLFAHTHARAHTTFPATMGLCASTPAGGSAASSTTTSKYKAAPRSEFDTRVAKALKRYQATAAELPKAQRVKSFNQVILRAGKIHKGFDVIKRVFRRFDADGSDSIDHGELTRALNVLSNQEVTREEAQRVFHEADLYENNMLSLKEFIVCLLLAHVLGHFALGGSGSGSGAEGKNEEQGGQQEDVYGGNAEDLKVAFNNIIGAYLLFDADASGDLSRDEVLRQLKNKEGVFTDAAAVSMMTEARWKELDWDGDGTITFREFIWAFQKWISTDAEDES